MAWTRRTLSAVAAVVLTQGVMHASALAQQPEQYVATLVFRTGQFAPLGLPWAQGKLDYYNLVNARGGINGVKIKYEECEMAYDTARGVECYQRMKDQFTGAPGIDPLSTGITVALSDRAEADGMPIFTPGYGASAYANGEIFKWNFPILANYWSAADVVIQDIKKKEGGNLKGKKIALVYHDSPYGKEPIPMLQARAKLDGFELLLLPVTAPGVEQKSTWLQVRQQRPDYTLLWSAGVMTAASVREAQATGYPREKMYAVWWAGSNHDVKELGMGAKGYNVVTIQNSAGQGAVHDAVKQELYAKGQGAGDIEVVGQPAHTHAMMNAMIQVEAIRTAQEKFGIGKPVTPEQVRWALENLNVTQERLEEIGFAGLVKPFKTSCQDHMGEVWSKISQWDGKQFQVVSDWYQGDKELVWGLIDEHSKRIAKEKGLTARDCSKAE